MDAIRIMNLRSLQDTGFIDLKPITILVGQNSSGKSTFLRTFPLIKQSLEERTTGPILWNGRYVDFGGFMDAVNKTTPTNEISFGFKFNFSHESKKRNNQAHGNASSKSIQYLEVIVRIRSEKNSGIRFIEEGYVHRIELLANNVDKYIVSMKPNGAIEKLLVNDVEIEFTETSILVLQNTLIPTLIFRGEYQWRRELSRIIFEKLEKSQQPHLASSKQNELIRLANSINPFVNFWDSSIEIANMEFVYSEENVISESMDFETISSILRESEIFLTPEQEDLFRRSFQIEKVSSLLKFVRNYINNFIKSCNYLGPIRATAERYYRSQNLSVSEVDFQGKNLAVFLGSLSTKEMEKFNKWTDDYFNFAVKIDVSSGHVSIIIKDRESEQNLADTGFGYSQILPVVTQLWSLISPKQKLINRSVIFTVEQPELHLHPKMQSRLAFAFTAIINQAKVNDIDLKLIIETHSDAMLNTFGRLIAKKELNQEDINIVLFEKPIASQPTIVRISTFDPRGFLKNWPSGFFEPDWG